MWIILLKGTNKKTWWFGNLNQVFYLTIDALSVCHTLCLHESGNILPQVVSGLTLSLYCRYNVWRPRRCLYPICVLWKMRWQLRSWVLLTNRRVETQQMGLADWFLSDIQSCREQRYSSFTTWWVVTPDMTRTGDRWCVSRTENW